LENIAMLKGLGRELDKDNIILNPTVFEIVEKMENAHIQCGEMQGTQSQIMVRGDSRYKVAIFTHHAY